MLEETETEETIDSFVTFLSLVTFQLWGGRLAPCPSGYPYVLGSFVLDMRKLLAISKAEFNSLVGAGMGSKPSGTRAAVVLPFGNKFKFGLEEARRIR